MEKIRKYSRIIHQELKRHAAIPALGMPGIQNQLIVNKNGNDFILLDKGWHQHQYYHDVIFHVEVAKDKVFIHTDNTDFNMASHLQELGIPAEDIVCTFLLENGRKRTNNPTEKRKKYSHIIRQELERHATMQTIDQPDISSKLFMTQDEDDFILMDISWKDNMASYGVIFHVEIKNEKVLIHTDNTDYVIADRLEELGIPANDIVCTFLAEWERELLKEERVMA